MTEFTALTDGDWHRLHPATPLLRGGLALVAIIGFVIVNYRDLFIQLVLGGPDPGEDPLSWLAEQGLAPLALAVLALGLLLFIAGFYLSWRFHSFRITDELVEVRSGVLFRTNRRGRLDRVQGVNVVRPFLARLFGTAKLEVNVAGQDANVELAYLATREADELRRTVLALAAGARPGETEVATTGTVLEQRMHELLAPELDPNAVAEGSVVRVDLGRLIGSVLLSGATVFFVIWVGLGIVFTPYPSLLIGFVPVVIGLGGYYFSRITRSLRYSIAGTTDGLRIGFGLLTTSNETLPPGRIHAVQVRQPLLWRPAGWWEIKINRASASSLGGSVAEAQTTILPVGNLAEVRRVLELALPGLATTEAKAIIEQGLTARGGEPFVNSPRRAAVVHLFAWRRNGIALTPEAVLQRTGVLRRTLVIVPNARAQSVSIRQSPLGRLLRLANLGVQTVRGPVDAWVGALDQTDAKRLFSEIADATVRALNDEASPSPQVSS